MSKCLIVLLLMGLTASQISSKSAINLKIARRGGRFSQHHPANLTNLSSVLRTVEGKYGRTFRDVEGNKLVRRWDINDNDDFYDEHLLGDVGRDGSWYVTIPVGQSPQLLEFDLDMLSPDFYTVMTTSGSGSKYDTFKSSTHSSKNEQVHSLCRRSHDVLHLSHAEDRFPLDFPICTPSKSSRLTLLSSGSIFGLGPPGSLDRVAVPSVQEQIHTAGHISQKTWSLTILDAETGILSIGGTIAKEVERAKIQGQVELENFGNPIATHEWVQNEVDSRMKVAMLDQLPMDQHFRWTNVQGASGWWTALMAGVWINGAKVLKNQPVLFDIQSPFILAPPAAISRICESIGGSRRLPPPHDNFFAFPCLNQINVAFEFGGWNFPIMSGEGTRADAIFGPAGGLFSLGKLGNGTGYCVGNIVETRMGVRQEWVRSGVLDTWVLGEPFLRGLGVVFDVENGRIGVRSY